MWKIVMNRHTIIKLSVSLILIATVSQGQETMSELLQELKNDAVIKSDIVFKTMLDVDRKDFCPENSYEDAPQPIGYGATISAPHMHAYVLEVLKDHLVAGSSALDIGSGSGYITACMALMLGKRGVCTGIDHIPELVQQALENTKRHYEWLLSSKRIKYVTGDGRLGYFRGAPYDVIHCGANFDKPPEHIIGQLKPGGRFVGPIGSRDDQYLTVIDKGLDGQLTEKKLMNVIYMPMQNKNAQISNDY